jgi:hypothetical protein
MLMPQVVDVVQVPCVAAFGEEEAVLLSPVDKVILCLKMQPIVVTIRVYSLPVEEVSLWTGACIRSVVFPI